jgi:hypothetical protein
MMTCESDVTFLMGLALEVAMGLETEADVDGVSRSGAIVGKKSPNEQQKLLLPP